MRSPAAALPLLSLTLACAPARPAEASPAPPPALQPREALARLLEAYDRAPAGPAREALARRIDDLAGQRYAAWSRLYWHRDLGAAIAEARETGRPILSLRMLGRLDRDLSCANSRFFRVALYANREVSRALSERFVLHWSSERPVPVARIDFGDGRVLERTVAGNSAHHVLDSRGRPVDVLPGLVGPGQFLDQLARAYPVARRSAALAGPARAALIAGFHRDEAARTEALFASLGTVLLGVGGPPPAGRDAALSPTSLADAELRAMSKAAVEMPVVRALQLGTQLPLDRAAAWDRTGRLWDQIGEALAARTSAAKLDANSRALFAALEPADWARAGQPLPAAGQRALIAAFEAAMARDGAYNELVLHREVHARMAAAPDASFADLSRWVYAELFLTPAEDPWLGMATPDAWSALPREGVRAAP